MGRKKQIRHKENQNNMRIIQQGHPLYRQLAGKWSEVFFNNKHKIHIELACGRGEYTIGLAKKFPHHNFIGVDIKGERIRHGAQKAQTQNLHNVGFIRENIHTLQELFTQQELHSIRIIHPDPRPKNRDAKRRLTHPRFLHIYKTLLRTNGCIHFKTDDPGLWQYTLETLINQQRTIHGCTHDLYTSPLYAHHHNIQTHYEKKFIAQGRTSKYLYASPPTSNHQYSCPTPLL